MTRATLAERRAERARIAVLRDAAECATYADNIRSIAALATLEQVRQGRAWYPAAGRIAAAIGEVTGTDTATVAAVIAALSPRNPWNWNVSDAAHYAVAARNGHGLPTATTYRANRARAWAFLTGESDWAGSALKVRSFVSNLTGDGNAVTVDVWAARAAGETRRLTDKRYRAIAEAYRLVAAEVAERPCDLQAITWLVARELPQWRRASRHAVTIKRGTLPFIAALLTL